MNIKCGNIKCGKVLKVDTAKVKPDNPLIRCPKCQQINRVSLPKQQPDKEAWLVRHTENMPTKTFALKPGKNTIGRKAMDASFPVPDIQVTKEEDARISRGVHCTLEVVENGDKLRFVLYDSNSTNGTFINEKAYRLKPGDEEYIEDGETIQAGRTKFVLKTNRKTKSAQEAQTLVQQTDYTKTVII